MATAIWWVRRDFRIGDNPALVAAAAAGDVLPVFVLDDRLWQPAGDPRRAWLVGCLHWLRERTGGALVVRAGDPAEELVAVARRVGAATVVAAADYGPYGRERDDRVEEALGGVGVAFERHGTPWAVAPGVVTKADGTPFKVFTPYSRAWAARGWGRPLPAPDVRWATGHRGVAIPDAPAVDAELLPVGEDAALEQWRHFRDGALADYAEGRDRPDGEHTSRMSVYLKYGCTHPRTMLADLDARNRSAATYRSELCWRDFYADVLWHRPDSARRAFNPAMATMQLDTGPTAEARLAAWREGRTGYPIVDAGMRQLLAEAWVHNRVRMIVASFLVKDLHVDWTLGARWFMARLQDGELSSNNHGWQWVAGTGTDAAPYFRVFNPITQGRKFDPRGDYVRRFVPELRAVAGAAVHEPWSAPAGAPAGYPERIVDHAAERAEALRRYEDLRRSAAPATAPRR
ncbi:MAG TPA: deoxyribodipyrimidine photo-lyase [Acidimicrobiales bacterium]|nr:deoxyribodipyrimidine photo-lyase [Acidimicrobiales bacterium]